jgi:peptide/nickel transport system permease protein
VHGRRGSLVRFLVRRIASAAIVVFIVGSATLLLSTAAAGDFFSLAFGFGGSDDTVRHARERAGLDRPVTTIYTEWLAHAARFDFGTSLKYQRPVGPFVIERAANTAVLGVTALAVALLLGVPLGVLTGSGGRGAAIVRALSSVCLSMPPLIAAILLLAFAATTGLAPVSGMTSLSSDATGWLERVSDIAWHVAPPAVALALPFVAMLERVQSQAVAQSLEEPSMTAALARGLSYRQMLWRHAWLLSLKPVAAVAGPMAGTLLSGSFAVEYVMSWPGLGRLTFDALVSRDVYLAAGCAAAAAVVLALAMLASDVLLAAVDPRIAETRDTNAVEELAL